MSIKRVKVNQIFSSPYVQVVLVAVLILALGLCFMKRPDQDAWLGSIRLANDKVKAGDYLEAEDLYLKAKEQCEAIFGKNDARVGTCLGYLAELYLGEQEYVKAAMTYKSLIEIEQQYAPKSAELERDIKEYQFVLAKLKEYGLEEFLEQAPKSEDKISRPENTTP